MQINSMASLYQLFQSLYANGNKNRSQTTSKTQAPPLSPQAFVNLFGGLPFDPSMFAGGNFPGVSFRSTGNGDGGGAALRLSAARRSAGGAGGTDPQPMLGLQQKTDKEQEQMQLLSNLQKKKHDTCMAIIANIR